MYCAITDHMRAIWAMKACHYRDTFVFICAIAHHVFVVHFS